MSGLTKAAQDVLAERQRQVSAEGWTAKHDDEHDRGEIARAAGCYALHAGDKFAWSEEDYRTAAPHEGNPEVQDTLWPWDREWWKPKNPRRDLVRAAALLLAEIERLDRAEASRWKPCARCTTPDYCTNQLRGCDIAESLEAGIAPLADGVPALNPDARQS